MGQLDGVPVKEEAAGLAARLWCEPQWSGREMDVPFAESIRNVILGVIQQREAWIEEAQQAHRNTAYWRERAGGTAAKVEHFDLLPKQEEQE